MGWEALKQWGGNAVRLEQLTGGMANEVWSVRLGGRPLLGRRLLHQTARRGSSDMRDWLP